MTAKIRVAKSVRTQTPEPLTCVRSPTILAVLSSAGRKSPPRTRKRDTVSLDKDSGVEYRSTVARENFTGERFGRRRQSATGQGQSVGNDAEALDNSEGDEYHYLRAPRAKAN